MAGCVWSVPSASHGECGQVSVRDDHGDLAQLLSINSEIGNINFSPEYYDVLSGGIYDLDTIVHIVQAAAESGYKSLKKPIDFDEFEVCEWIDEVGGLSAKDGQLVEFMRYMQDSMKKHSSCKTSTQSVSTTQSKADQ